MANTPHRHRSVSLKLSDEEFQQYQKIREKLSLSASEIFLIGLRRASSQFAAEMRRQRRLEGDSGG